MDGFFTQHGNKKMNNKTITTAIAISLLFVVSANANEEVKGDKAEANTTTTKQAITPLDKFFQAASICKDFPLCTLKTGDSNTSSEEDSKTTNPEK